ncbi:MAG: class I SAM-dependent methyltransferase [Pseudomonadota bacterium]
MAVRPYYAADGASAEFYDLLTDADGSIRDDVDIYAGLVPAGAHILELGAGTGRVAIALAERGYRVTGIDVAAPMLAQADAKRLRLAPDVAERVRFVRGDLVSLALGRRFDAIIVTYFTLAHLQPASTWKKAFAGMARHLVPGGPLAIHLPVAEKMDRPAPDPSRPVFRRALDGDRLLTLYVAGQVMNRATGRFDLTLDYVTSTSTGIEIHRSRERLTYFHADPRPYAEKAGFELSGDPVPLGDKGMIHLFRRKS